MGDKLGDVTFGREYKTPTRGHFPSVRVPITVRGINGVTYHGTYFKSSGDYARVKASAKSLKRNPGMTRSEARDFRRFCEQATNMQCLNIHAEEKKRAKRFAGTDEEEYYEECRDIAREVCEERGLL